jgi:DNA-binding NarL/FixJ family response regulator
MAGRRAAFTLLHVLCGGQLVDSVRVVVVDDHAAMRRTARDVLRFHGFAVVGEADGAEGAFDIVDRLCPDAVLLDVGLGADDGYDVCWALTDRHPRLAVLLTSADPLRDDAARRAAVRARGFVAKSELLRTDLGAYLRLPV